MQNHSDNHDSRSVDSYDAPDIDDEEDRDRDRDRDRENNLSYAESEVSTYVYWYYLLSKSLFEIVMVMDTNGNNKIIFSFIS